jgi:hypothetical protein
VGSFLFSCHCCFHILVTDFRTMAGEENTFAARKYGSDCHVAELLWPGYRASSGLAVLPSNGEISLEE